ncbi:helix-turn-helix transcriptional regulator [Phormidium sp. CLA17]|nr:helix-turn-helix transcriptional regulator [Leptolyngbya sp. Cla-17]
MLQTTKNAGRDAFELGFSSQAHFITSFRKDCGVTPYKFRRKI